MAKASRKLCLFEVMDSRGEKSLALFPAKFHKSMWMKRGSFVVVNESGKEKALESGSKVGSIVSQVLFYEQVRALQKSPEWPESFKSTTSDDTNGSLQKSIKEEEVNHELDSSDEDGLPPLEANTNRVKPPQYESDSESNSGSDTDS
ncbi:uncharacterized protein [Euphorbia lathyris]|uniref:uncharacterized protein isoform X3 n=1 Tax=Euphorbia lathyris TaxID=212925 RepID=UPI003313D9A1